jgi:hypothetical protein
MELVLALLGLLTALFGALKALLELLRSKDEKEDLNKRDPTVPQRKRT